MTETLAPPNPLRDGNRSDIRDRILELLSDGKERHISEIVSELNYDKKTNINKTLNEIKVTLVTTRTGLSLVKKKFDNCRKGSVWTLIKSSSRNSL